MKNRLLVFLFVVSMYPYFSLTQAQEEPKAWSKVALDNLSAFQNVNVRNDYVPENVQPRKYSFKGIEAVVYPNYRPLPTTNTTQSELSIDIHPLNMNVIFTGSNATPWPVAGIYGTGVYWTTNGGTNWTGFDNPPFGTNSGDPAAAIGTNGNFYMGFIDGGANDGGQGVGVSTNFGSTWQRYVVAPKPPSTSDLLDKNHLTVDKKPGSPYENRVYAAWTAFVSSSPNNNNIEVRYSTDNGATWSASANISAAINAGSHNQGVNLATGPNGEVYATWAVYDQWASGSYGEDAIAYNVSTNGGVTWGTPKKIYTAPNFGIRGNLTSKANIRVSSFPVMAVDRSGGARNGWIYVTWPQKGVAPAGSDPDIVCIHSSDGGATWSAPVRVNDDPLNNGKDQYYSWATVDQATGHLYVIFYDSRATANDSAKVTLARSIDGGMTFENINIHDSKFKPVAISGLAGGYQGDYIGVAAMNNTVYGYWADNRTGNYQAWIAKVTFGPNIIHQPLPNTENLNGPYTVGAKILSALPLKLSTVKVYYGRTGVEAITDSILMTPVSADSFVANIPGNGLPATYQYYISAEDTTGGVSTSPAGAPTVVNSFVANTDLIPPVITHTAIGNQYRETWPVNVTAQVSDNIGVDTVKVVYKVRSNGQMMSFLLSGSPETGYSGTFNIDTSLIALGDTMYYRILAKDASNQGNWGYHPSASEYNTFVFVPDTDAPVITHNMLRNQAKIRWPAVVKATISDNLGIRSAKVFWQINNGPTGSFNLSGVNGGTYSGSFNIDTSQIVIGDTIRYRIEAIDISTSYNTTNNPASGYNKFAIINTLGVVLVINDDVTVEDRISNEKEGQRESNSPLGISGTLIATTLSQAGYVVDTVQWAAVDTTTFFNYDVIAISTGIKTGTTIIDNLGKRTALVNYTLGGGKTFVEGGEIGYTYRKSGTTTDKDPNFRRNILHDSTWVSDVSSGVLRKRMTNHQLWNSPHFLADSAAITGTGIGYRDAMRTIPGEVGVFKLAGWYPTYLDTAGIIAYSPTNDPDNIRNLFFTFSVGHLTNTAYATKLIENAFSLLMGSSGQIPVEFTSFNATVNLNEVVLNWETATETNNSGFSIERKTAGGEYTSVGFVNGMGTTLIPTQYQFIDRNLSSGVYTYRLKQVDFDGTSTYSNEINVDLSAPAVYALEQNYPNPFNPETVIKFSIPQDEFVSVEIMNVLGEKVATLLSGVQKAGRYEVKFDGSKFSSGLYFYKLETANFKSIKKMMLLK